MNSHKKNILELLILFLLIISTFLMWDSIIIFPIKFLVVLLHEISHGISAILTGGKIIALEINSNLGGKCITEDGNQFLIAFSGYSGSFLFGAILFYSTYKPKMKMFVTSIIAIIIFLFAVNIINNTIFSFISILIAISFFIINKFLPDFVSNIFFRSVGLISCIYVIYDVKEDVFNNNSYLSDASVIADITGLSSTYWGLLWILFSLIGIIFLITQSFRKNKLY